MGKTTVIEKRRLAETPVEADAPVCQHHWLIETPQGATSRGRCKRCGEEREFRNSATDHLWEDESGSGYNAWRGVRASTPKPVSDDEEASAAGAASGGSLLAV